MLRFLLICVIASVASAAAGPVRLCLPFDGNAKPAIGGGAKAPRVPGGKSLRFAPGLRGQALLVGGKGSPTVTYDGPEYADPSRGTVTMWVKPTDWDSSEQKGCYFFRLLHHAFLYN